MITVLSWGVSWERLMIIAFIVYFTELEFF